MAFLGSPCPCGWAYDEIADDQRFCERCGRLSTYKNKMWNPDKPSVLVEKLTTQAAKREYANNGLKLSPLDPRNNRRAAIREETAKRLKFRDKLDDMKENG